MERMNAQRLFDEITAKYGENRAIEGADGAVSYVELQAKSNALANFLISSKVEKGSPVAVLMDNRVEGIIAFLGVLKAGCVFTPLDPLTPISRLRRMISDVRPEWYIAESKQLGIIEELAENGPRQPNVLQLDDQAGANHKCHQLNLIQQYSQFDDSSTPSRSIEPEDICCIYFISRSGRLKAITEQYKSIDHYICWEIRALGLSDDARVSQLFPHSVDGALKDILVPLYVGGTACVPQRTEAIDNAPEFIDWVDNQRVSLIHCTPSLLRLIMNEAPDPRVFSLTRQIVLSGELPAAFVKRWFGMFGARIQLIATYGSCETAIAKFSYFVKPSDKDRVRIPIGKPINGAAAIVVDETEKPCPPGAVGEIYIRTPYRSPGYYSRPEPDEPLFIRNPFSSDPGDLVQKTGDLGRILEDGNFERLGRKDLRVEIRGISVDPREIESDLRDLKVVEDAAVVRRTDTADDVTLCAYLVLKEACEIDEIRDHLLKRLPDYMIPSQIVLLKALPRDSNGRVDHRALPPPPKGRKAIDRPLVAARDIVEESLAAIYSIVLKENEVGINDNFFQLGGHSIHAVQAMAQIRRILKIEITLHLFYRLPTVSQLAEHFEASRKGLATDALLEYWKRQLAGCDLTLMLPTDRPRPAIRSSRYATTLFTSPAEVVRPLKDLSRQNGATLFMTLLAAYQTLLSRYTGQEDFCVGWPVANRDCAENEGMAGVSMNTLALRADLSSARTFRELLWRVREATLGAYTHRDLPFETLVKELQPDRDRSGAPLFQVTFDLGKGLPEAPASSDLNTETPPIGSGAAHTDLAMHLMEDGDLLRGKITYAADIFESATIERMISQFQTLLESVIAFPDRSAARLPLLPEDERRRLLYEWNDAEGDYPKGMCLHQLFEAQVERAPDSIAAVFEDRLLSYQELNARANRLASRLRRRGVGPDVPVCMYLERSLEMIVGILAVLKAGGAYVPMDTAYPEERLAFMLDDTKAQLLLTMTSLRENLPARHPQVICIDQEWESIALESRDNIMAGTSADSLAYIIYTSGSTGNPKGVQVTHYNVIRLLQATRPWYGFDERDVWSLFHSYAFDVSVWELWGALLYGGRLAVASYGVSRSPERFYELLIRENATILSQTPSAFRKLIQAEEKVGTVVSTLRLVIFGGEMLELQSLKPWFDRHGDKRPQLVNMYGITETTVHSTYRPISEDDLIRMSGSPIGRAIPDLQIYILDQQMEPVPTGAPGEMYVGGAGLARGYLQRSELSAQRFVADPFNKDSGGRLYKSGDLARYLANGDIEYLGRIDHQVKIRGFRIELGEIEMALNTYRAVRESVALVREDTHGEKRLVAYLVSQAGQTITAGELRRFLEKKLPDYMMPAAFVMLDAMPLTPNGKIDRKALPEPSRSRPELAESYRAPRDQIEELLAGVWAEALKLERIGVDDNFFDLGGNSFLLLRVQNKLEEAFKIQLPIVEMFENPTISSLTKLISKSAENRPSLRQRHGRAEARAEATERNFEARRRHRSEQNR
jgi:amino acid adenylation domain-containing protein